MISRGVGVRAVVSIALAGAVLSGLTACNFFSPQTTLERYDPSDGVSGSLGDLEVRNALLVTTDGTRASLVVSVVNSTDSIRTLEIQYDSGSTRATTTVFAAANAITQIGGGTGAQVVLEDVEAPAGALLPLYFQSGDAEGQELQVPVLDGTLGTYTGLTPGPSPTPMPTPTPTPMIIETPGPTETPVPDDPSGTEGVTTDPDTDDTSVG